MTEPCRMGALEAASAIAEGKLTAEALTESCLARIAEREDTVQAWIALDPDLAREQAGARKIGIESDPLHGVPAGIKDVIDSSDLPTGYGSPIYEGYRPERDAACVALMRAAGLTLLGKTVSTEFAYTYPGKTRNPHNPAHTPGGSSSGSAAAVADFMVPVAAGTQTGGSVIRPASYCGVVGYKPSYGRIPRAGLKFLAESLDTIGTYGRSVADAAAFAAALDGTPRPIVDAANGAPRIGLCRSPTWQYAEESSRVALDAAAKRLSDAGAKVTDVDLPAPFERAVEAHAVIIDFEGWRSLAYERENHPDQMSQRIRDTLDQGRRFSPELYADSLAMAAGCRAALNDVFEDFDVLLTPSAPGEAPRDLTITGESWFNRIWTMVGVPCITLPGLTGPQGLPVGVQIIGPGGQDERALACAAWAHPFIAEG